MQKGFTLIEIIFVVFIIGLSIGLVSLSVGGNSAAERSHKEAEFFLQLASYIAEQSVLRGETHGLFVELRKPDNAENEEQWCYEWKRVRDRQWAALPELEPHCLSENVVIEFVIEKKVWEYDPELEYQDPVIGFFPSGDSSGEVKISIFANQVVGSEKEEIQEIELNVMGELLWINEEERLEQERKGR